MNHSDKHILPKEQITPLQTVMSAENIRPFMLSDQEMKKRMTRINDDFHHAFQLIKKYPNTVTFFGSSVISPNSKYYKQARELAYKVVEELGLSIVSGGGPGIMEAANRGAKDAEGDSIGAAIELPHEQVKNRYITHSADFYYFFSRKVALTFTARAYIYFPGGFGTLDELFEILTLKQTGKIRPIPVILCGVDYWQPLVDFINHTLYKEVQTIDKADLTSFMVEDNPDEIIRAIASGRQTNQPVLEPGVNSP